MLRCNRKGMEGKFGALCSLTMLIISQNAFGVPYSVCGCVPDPDGASGTFSRLAAKFRSSKEPPAPLVNPRPDLVSTEDADANASHPSEHNVEVGDPNSTTTRLALSRRTAKAERRLNRAKQACTNPKRDPWVQLQAERNAKQDRHREAFTDPMLGAAAYYPYWGIAMFPPYGSVAHGLDPQSAVLIRSLQVLWRISLLRG